MMTMPRPLYLKSRKRSAQGANFSVISHFTWSASPGRPTPPERLSDGCRVDEEEDEEDGRADDGVTSGDNYDAGPVPPWWCGFRLGPALTAVEHVHEVDHLAVRGRHRRDGLGRHDETARGLVRLTGDGRGTVRQAELAERILSVNRADR
jgi:hypothetical protein